jgi:hypothetical protein
MRIDIIICGDGTSGDGAASDTYQPQFKLQSALAVDGRTPA